MPREYLKREGSKGSDADGSEHSTQRTVADPFKPPLEYGVVQSDDEDLPVEDLEWALAQRATDPYFRQRKQRGRFLFIKITGCEGFHCYEDELIARLQQHGFNVQSGPSPPARRSTSAEDAVADAKQLSRNSSFNSIHSRRHKRDSRPDIRHSTRPSAKAATGCTAAAPTPQAVHCKNSGAGRKRWERTTQE